MHAAILYCSEMGYDAIIAYSGSKLALVGELGGDTGTKKFQKELQKNWTCEDKCDLPNFPNTCYSLTIWRRNVDDDEGSTCTLQMFNCCVCNKSKRSDPPVSLRRCRATGDVVFCSPECAEAGRRLHSIALTSRMIFVDPKEFSYDLDEHFRFV